MVFLFVWGVAAAQRRRAQVWAAWRGYVERSGARTMGVPEYPLCQLQLVVDGMAVKLRQWTEGTPSRDDERPEEYCEIQVRLTRSGLEAIRIVPEGLIMKVGKLFGME